MEQCDIPVVKPVVVPEEEEVQHPQNNNIEIISDLSEKSHDAPKLKSRFLPPIPKPIVNLKEN